MFAGSDLSFLFLLVLELDFFFITKCVISFAISIVDTKWLSGIFQRWSKFSNMNEAQMFSVSMAMRIIYFEP